MFESLIMSRRPAGTGWRQVHLTAAEKQSISLGYEVEAWIHESGIRVFSSLEVAAPEPGAEELGPEYHLSMSGPHMTRVTRQHALWVLQQFGLEDATEDNHVPHGFVRNFWRPVADSLSGYQCPCVEDEAVVKEDKGDFVWRGR